MIKQSSANDVEHDASQAEGMSRRQFIGFCAAGVALPLGASSFRESPNQEPASGIPGDQPLHYLSLKEVARLIESRQLSPVELTRLMLDRIDAVDTRLLSYATVMGDHAMTAARQAETEIQAGNYRGPLHGVPIAVKDLCYTDGVRTMGGTGVLADFVPDFDATVVVRLEEAGAVILGKLNLSEGAFGPYHPDFDVPLNPWDASRWSGVSSSGSGVATAAGLCFGSLGTDTGGSIRYPAAANGTVGLKPTYGRVSRYGVLPLAESMDHVGPMTRRVVDAALMFEAIAGVDPNDPTSLRELVPRIQDELDRGVGGLRLGYDRRYATEQVESGLAAAIEKAVAELTSMGAEIVEVEMPDVGEVGAAWFTLCLAEAVAAHEATYPSRALEYGDGFRGRLEQGAQITGAEYAKADKVRAEFTGRLNALLSTFDALVCPSLGGPAFPTSRETRDAILVETYGSSEFLRNDVFTKPFNFSGSPTLSVPCGFSHDGLPYSIQFVGNRLDEATICRIGHAYEEGTDWHTKHPTV